MSEVNQPSLSLSLRGVCPNKVPPWRPWRPLAIRPWLQINFVLTCHTVKEFCNLYAFFICLFVSFRAESDHSDHSEKPTVTMKSHKSNKPNTPEVTMETDAHKTEFLPGTVIGCPEIGSEGNFSSFIHIWRGNLKAVDHSIVVYLPFEAIQVSKCRISVT